MASYKKSERTKRHLYEAAHALFLEKGYTATSLNDIAEAAGVAKGTLYNHYPSKGDFIIEAQVLSVEHLTQFAKTLPEGLSTLDRVCMVASEDLHGIARGFATEKIAEGGVEADLALASLSEPFTSIARLEEQFNIRTQLRDVYASIIRPGIASGELSADADADLLAELVLALYFHEIEFIILDPQYDFESEYRKKAAAILRGN